MFVCVETGLIIIFIMHRTVQIIIIKKYTRKVKKATKGGKSESERERWSETQKRRAAAK